MVSCSQLKRNYSENLLKNRWRLLGESVEEPLGESLEESFVCAPEKKNLEGNYKKNSLSFSSRYLRINPGISCRTILCKSLQMSSQIGYQNIAAGFITIKNMKKEILETILVKKENSRTFHQKYRGRWALDDRGELVIIPITPKLGIKKNKKRHLSSTCFAFFFICIEQAFS